MTGNNSNGLRLADAPLNPIPPVRGDGEDDEAFEARTIAYEGATEVAKDRKASSMVNKLRIKKKLMDTKFQQGMSMREHLDKLTLLFDSLSAINSAVAEDQKVMTILLSVEEEYNEIVTAIMSWNKERLTVKQVSDRLLEGWQKTSSGVVVCNSAKADNNHSGVVTGNKKKPSSHRSGVLRVSDGTSMAFTSNVGVAFFGCASRCREGSSVKNDVPLFIEVCLARTSNTRTELGTA